MHCDFLQWEEALQLAQTLAPHRLSDIYLKRLGESPLDSIS